MENITLKIDPDTHDIAMNDEGSMVLIGEAETTAQCIRVVLEVFLGEWFMDLDHGTDYDQIVGDGDGDPETVLRAAIYQETDVRYIDSLTISKSGREVTVAFDGRLKDGTRISLDVSA